MVFLRVTAATIAGIVFIASGFLKLMDPVGTSLIISEYLNVFHLSSLRDLCMPIGTGLSVIEFTLGISLALRIRLKETSWILLAFMIFMTSLTFYLAMFNPINDCGCFGEAIKLSNMETFIKNLVLLPMSAFIFAQRNNYRKLSSKVFEWSTIGFAAIAGLAISVFSFIYNPPVDFTIFKPGQYLEDATGMSSSENYESTFIYEKDGKAMEFSIDNLPDTSWTYVSATTRKIEDSENFQETMPIPLSSPDGSYMTEYIINGALTAIITTIYDQDISDKTISRVKKLADECAIKGIRHMIFCSGDEMFVSRLSEEAGIYSEIYLSDYKSIITLNRSNAGAVFVSDGEIIRKWPLKSLPDEKELDRIRDSDPKVLSVKEEIGNSLFWEILAFSALLILLIGNIILRRYNIRHHIVSETESGMEKLKKLQAGENMEEK